MGKPFSEMTPEQSLLLRYFNEFYNLITSPDRLPEEDMFKIIQTDKGIDSWRQKVKNRKAKEKQNGK